MKYIRGVLQWNAKCRNSNINPNYLLSVITDVWYINVRFFNKTLNVLTVVDLSNFFFFFCFSTLYRVWLHAFRNLIIEYHWDQLPGRVYRFDLDEYVETSLHHSDTSILMDSVRQVYLRAREEPYNGPWDESTSWLWDESTSGVLRRAYYL